jgi:DnaK suppressor protein
MGWCYRPSTMAKETLTAKEREELRTALERERTELQAQLAEIEASTFSQAQSDLSGEMSFDDEYADAGTATFERERDLSLENNVRDLLGKIEKALTRMDEGTYGTCERCGKPIEKARLKALPYANLCIADAQAASRPR